MDSEKALCWALIVGSLVVLAVSGKLEWLPLVLLISILVGYAMEGCERKEQADRRPGKGVA
jgi:hypothetical protein